MTEKIREKIEACVPVSDDVFQEFESNLEK